MTADLIIFFGEKPGSAWQWGLTSDGKAGLAATDQQKSELKTLNFKRLMVVIPGQQVVIKLHTLGKLNDKQKHQAAGFSIEDELASPLEQNHIALDVNSDRLAVVANHVMENVISELAKYDLSADIICADYDSFADTDSFVYQDRILQRSGNGLGYSAEVNLAAALLDKGQAVPQQIDDQEFLQKIYTALQAGYMAINLRQGIFAKRGKIGVGRFKRSLGLATAVLVVFAGSNIYQGVNALRKTQDLQAQMAGIYTQIFPNKKVPENPALDVIRAQSDAKTDNKQWFIELSALLAASAQKVSGVEVSSLRYDAARQQLNLSIRYLGFDDVEALKQAVADHGGIFTESGTRQSGGALLGDAILRLGK